MLGPVSTPTIKILKFFPMPREHPNHKNFEKFLLERVETLIEVESEGIQWAIEEVLLVERLAQNLSVGWHRANFIFPSWRDDASKVFLECLQSKMNLNRVVNYLYISLDGQILKNTIGWQHNVRGYKTERLWKSLITCIDMHENPKIKH